MSKSLFVGSVDFLTSATLMPWSDPGEYVHEVTGRALDVDDEEVGTIRLKFVSSTEAENRGLRLLDVFDSESSLLEAVFSTLFDTQGEPREKLDIELAWNNLLFVDEVQIQPEYESSSARVALIETSAAMFCPSGLVVAEEESLELSVEDWRQLGFKRIANSPFVFRDQMKMNPYKRPPTEAADEAAYTCDACGEEIVIPIDLSQGSSQRYVEDCPVCCRSNVIHIEIEEAGNVTVWAEPEQDYE